MHHLWPSSKNSSPGPAWSIKIQSIKRQENLKVKGEIAYHMFFIRGICQASPPKVMQRMRVLWKPMAKAYLDLYNSAMAIREFYGLRDYYRWAVVCSFIYRCILGSVICPWYTFAPYLVLKKSSTWISFKYMLIETPMNIVHVLQYSIALKTWLLKIHHDQSLECW